MASIAGGIAAWYGTTTFQSIFAQTRKIEERVVEQQKKIDDQLKIAEENTKNFDNWRKEAETKNRAMQIKLIKFYVVQRYHDFQENFDRLRLDELHRSKSAYANIRLILGELKNAEDFPNELLEDAERKLIIHMEQLVKAVTLYDDIKYDEVTSAPTQTDGSGWSEASRCSAGQLGESPVCICALVHRLRRMVQAGAKRRAALRGSWVNHLSASVH